MKECPRQFGALTCSKLGVQSCALALNDAWTYDGNIHNKHNKAEIAKKLVERGEPYCVKLLLLHELENVTDDRVRRFLVGANYELCLARHDIAEIARMALDLMRVDYSDLDVLGRSVFTIPEQSDPVVLLQLQSPGLGWRGAWRG